MKPQSGNRESGATLVESAFAIPIVLMFIMALLDLGIWAMKNNQAASAARDGARAGILAFTYADLASSDERDLIVEAVLERLPADTATPANVTISCMDPAGTPIPCATARLDMDRIRVDVQWEWPMFSPLAGSIGSGKAAASGSASMVIVGLPTEGPTQ